MKMNTLLQTVVAALALAGFGSSALAQSGASLMIKPWSEGVAGEVDTGLIIQGQSESRDAAAGDFSLQRYTATGRVRYDVADEHSPAVGFDVLHYNINSTRTGVPDELTDQSVAVGFGIGEYSGWEIGATVGGGYAGNNPYADGNGYYATANLIASRRLSETETLQIVINHNGNRGIFPDVPLPGFAYHHKLSDTFTYTAGLPFSSLTWTPTDRARLKVHYTVPFTFDVVGEYTITKAWIAHAGFYNDFNAFHVDGADGRRRIFFQQRRVEAGLRWVPCDWMRAELAGGYSFDQEFNTGWDARDQNNPIKIGDAPYMRFGLDVKF